MLYNVHIILVAFQSSERIHCWRMLDWTDTNVPVPFCNPVQWLDIFQYLSLFQWHSSPAIESNAETGLLRTGHWARSIVPSSPTIGYSNSNAYSHYSNSVTELVAGSLEWNVTKDLIWIYPFHFAIQSSDWVYSSAYLHYFSSIPVQWSMDQAIYFHFVTDVER
jgi:hypothetical protein